jgi:hypothetical protein
VRERSGSGIQSSTAAVRKTGTNFNVRLRLS